MSRLSRLKSMMRYIRLWPPPRHHEVSWPTLLRPPEVCIGSTNGLCGSSVVMSSKVCTVWNREPGDVGLNLRMGMVLRPLPEFRHLGAFAQAHVRLLPARAASREAPLPLHLAVGDARADALDFGAEQLLDRALDFRLVRAGRHLEDDRASILAED